MTTTTKPAAPVDPAAAHRIAEARLVLAMLLLRAGVRG